MKKLLASLFALIGFTQASSTPPSVQTIDPKSILFSTPTLSNDIAPLTPFNRKPSTTDFIFHEDEWRQVEFFPKARLPEIQRLLKEFKPFEQAHRVKHGWRDVYVRRIVDTPVLASAQPVQQLEKLLGAKAGAAPLLFSSNTVSGSVTNGFSLALGGNVTLYGYTDEKGIPVLGAHVGNNPDDSKLTTAFMKLNAKQNLILVDWRAQLVLVAITPSGQIDIWQP